MDARWLDDFLSVIDCGSFTLAALRRGVSQSGLSRRVQALEHWLGTPLFDRRTQPVRLTLTGSRFAQMAIGLRSMLDAAQAPQPWLMGYHHPRVVTIAASDGLEAGLLPQLLGGVRRQRPHAPVRVVGHGEQQARASLLSGQALLWLVAQDPQAPLDLPPALFHAKPVARDRLVTVTAARGGQPLYELPGTPYRPVPHVDYVETHPLARALDQRLARERTLPYLCAAGTAESMSALRALVAQGLGIGMVYESMVDHELRTGELQPVNARWVRPVEVLLVRPRCVLPASPVAALVNDIWELILEVPEPPCAAPATAGERNALLVSDVVD